MAVGDALEAVAFPTRVLAASGRRLVNGICGRSPATKEHRDTEVAVPQVPTSSCDGCPAVALNVVCGVVFWFVVVALKKLRALVNVGLRTCVTDPVAAEETADQTLVDAQT
jgi:hypothetical protein